MDVHQDAYVNEALLDAGKAGGEKKIVVDVSKQRAYLLIDGQVAIDTAVSTARTGKYTPRGEFKITERVKSGKTSTIYGCSLPYWQRLGDSPVGMHIGDLPGYPASAGCIRLPYSVAPVIFENTASGVTVQIVDSWSGPAPQAGQNLIVAQVVSQPIDG
jgi:lipoprotein-anchoring transpeptidase ErfK/SrfK